MSSLRAFVSAGAVAVCAAIILPILFGERPTSPDRVGGDAWRNLIYDFQTLIAGVFAVAAAWWTVNMMDKTERSDARRHAEQIDLALRADRLRMDRALYPQFDELKTCRRQVQKALNKYADTYAANLEERIASGDMAPEAEVLESVIDDVGDGIELLRQVLNRSQFDEGMALFDGDLTYRVLELRRRIDDTLPMLETALSFYHGMRRYSNEGVEYHLLFVDGGEDKIISCCNYFVNHADGILDGMKRMAEIYRVTR